MSYNPSDHAIEPRRIVSAWALSAAILLMALGGSVISDKNRPCESLLPERAGQGAVSRLTESSWVPTEHGHTGEDCLARHFGVPHNGGWLS